MKLVATLFSALAAVVSVQAITVSVDRADIQQVSIPQPNQGQSMFLNGWRPLNTNYDNIGINLSPLNNFDRSLTSLRPVLGKLQEHMTVSDRLKPQRQEKPHQIEYNPTNLLGSFTVFSHVVPKHRIENPASTDPKSLSTEKEYTFLVPPRRDSLRYEVESQKKAPIRENEPYVRSSQFMPQVIKPDSRSPTYYIKPAQFSTNIHPFSQGRPFVNGYSAQQSLIPPRFPAKQYDELKAPNEKPYFQSAKISNGFNKDNKVNGDQAYDNFQPQQAVQQLSNNNFYNQINHAAQYKQSTYERDPSFLVHESHEVSYVTPSSSFKYRPLSYHYDNSVQDAYTSSTVPSRIELNKFTQQQTPSSLRSVGFKQFQTSTKISDKHHQEPHRGLPSAYYITDFQKTRYTPDINEVLPKTNPPAKFNQVSTTPVSYVPDHRSKIVYVRPELQQQPQYQSSVIPLNINQRPPEVEYETPESISLKHFNEQQFLLQQQLIHQDRQRLREQEKRRQQELQRQQQEEVDRRQHELKLLEQKQNEKEQLEQIQTVEPDIIKEVPLKHHFIQHYPIEGPKIVPKEQYKFVYHPQQFEPLASTSEMPFELNKEKNSYKKVTVQKFEEIVTPAATEATTQEDFQPLVRPYRPQKPFRDQVRRRKPTTLIYDPVPTELPTYYNVESSTESLTDIPIQTTSLPETTTAQTTERTIRTRRPGAGLRRRRPSSTTTSEPNEYEEAIRYNTPEVQDFEKKRRVRPAGSNYQDNLNERRPLRKRPGHRVKLYNKDRDDIDVVPPQRARTTEKSLRDISPTENYPEAFLKELYSSEYLSTSDKALTENNHQEVHTENVPIEFYSETTPAPTLGYFEPTRNDEHVERYPQKIEDNGSLEQIFTKTEVNQVETTSPSSPSTYSIVSSTSTTTEAPITSKSVVTSTKTTHRVRPVRYGNATRPRFSIKDYKSRLDYKNRLTQSSSTEASTVTATTKLRNHKTQQSPADPNFKEAAGRYKYTPRSPSYRTSTSSSVNSQVEDANGATTDKNVRYTPKKRINPNHYYRNRVASKDQEGTLRSDGSSPPIRKRPGLKNRPQLLSTGDRINKLAAPDSPEMQSAAETGFFATTTPSSNPTEAVNEIAESQDTIKQEIRIVTNEAHGEKALADLSDVTMDENEGVEKEPLPILPDQSAQGPVNNEENTENNHQLTITATPEPTTAFDIRHEEELFAKASQSVADLTSSASALYDKPGMFKAVSPGNENNNRLISAHLKIATDEPTLPIEAFFQDISKKN